MRVRGWADPASLRAAWWTVRALNAARRDLRVQLPVDVVIRTAPHGLPERAFRGVRFVLKHRDALCLESALIRQQWLADSGRFVDVVIGVTSPRDFRAHAWLDGFEPESTATYVEILRRSALGAAAPAPAPARSQNRICP